MASPSAARPQAVFPQFDEAGARLLFFLRGRGRGHVIPSLEIVRRLEQRRPDVQIRLVSYDRGAETLAEQGRMHIDLGLPEANGVAETTVLAGKLIGWLEPDLVAAYEEFAALPVAKIFDRPALFLTDWFVEPHKYSMQTLRFADEVLFLGERGDPPPPWIDGNVRYLGPLLRTLSCSRHDRHRLRQELGLPPDARVVGVFPGSWTEDRVPLAQPLVEAFEALPPPKRLIWLAGDDAEALRNRFGGRDDMTIFARDWQPERLMAAADVAVTKATRKTLIELMALGIPAVSVTHDGNPIDQRKAQQFARFILPAAERDLAGRLKEAILQALAEPPPAPRPPQTDAAEAAAERISFYLPLSAGTGGRAES